jgi:predicted small secreted protein
MGRAILWPTLMVGLHPMVTGSARIYSSWMNSSPKRFALLVLSIALLSFVTAGCQTTKGFGKDVEKLGDNIQDSAK